VAAQWFEDTPSEFKLKDLNIKTTANGFKYCSVAAIWDKGEERKSDIRSRSHSRPVAVCRERSNSGTLYRSPPSTRRRSRSRKESHRRRSHEPHGGDQRSSSVSMRNVDEFNLGLKPTNRDEEERRRNERAKRFALSGGESSTAGGGGKRARRGRS